MIPFLEWAHAGCVLVFHIKPATEAHIPVVVLFVDVQKLRIVVVWLSPWAAGICLVPPPYGTMLVIGVATAPVPRMASANDVRLQPPRPPLPWPGPTRWPPRLVLKPA